MKNVVLFFSFFFVLGITAANAQSCHGAAAAEGKSCCASKMAKAAAADPSIEKRMADDGSVAYVRKESDAQGNVKFVSVQFDETSSSFINVAPKTLSADAKAGMVKKSCAGDMKACAGGEKKACGAKEGKACCASKAKEQ